MSQRPPDQLPLFWLCHVCGTPHLDGRQHRACHRALDRWFRDDNLDEWSGHLNRAAL
ncbi:hypothetical protein [Mycobacterium kyogaense]|uniref:hypothetical protein n=1 Tax=Mycobacterium kyogaense TaxID=2212479 RepID=UPI0013C442B6|nr:hypothetical protein [Mycobacterium kyogaense]